MIFVFTCLFSSLFINWLQYCKLCMARDDRDAADAEREAAVQICDRALSELEQRKDEHKALTSALSRTLKSVNLNPHD